MDLSKMCRICGELFSDRFETVQDHKEHIYKYLPVMDKDHDFPKNLCFVCLTSIDSWNVFYNRCEGAQQKFAEMLIGKVIENDSNGNSEGSPTSNKELTNGHGNVDADEAAKQNIANLSCNFCTTHYESQSQLNEHLIFVHCDLVFCCDLCKNYKPRDDLISHMTQHALSSLQDSKTSDKFQCPECSKPFLSSSGLKHHMTYTHTREKQFPCDECDHVFSSKRVLLNHFRSMHSNEKPFKCNECDKSFKTDSTLFSHRKIHSQETPHKCFDCGKGFKFKHHLDAHSLHHRPLEKTFECSCCHKKFTTLNNLSKHRKIHDKTADFGCHICGVKLLQKRYLRDHMRRVHQTRLDSLETAN